jgi:predicted DCC family thiol-disulfide oxidoreductase YuxK
MREHPVVLFDGLCNLCGRSVRYIIRQDPNARFQFAPLQSKAGRELQERYGFGLHSLDTVILIEGGKAYTKSDAALRIMRRLEGPVRFWWLTRFVPRFLRDAIYDWVGRNRYRWFGRRDDCIVPAPHLRETLSGRRRS